MTTTRGLAWVGASCVIPTYAACQQATSASALAALGNDFPPGSVTGTMSLTAPVLASKITSAWRPLTLGAVNSTICPAAICTVTGQQVRLRDVQRLTGGRQRAHDGARALAQSTMISATCHELARTVGDGDQFIQSRRRARQSCRRRAQRATRSSTGWPFARWLAARRLG